MKKIILHCGLHKTGTSSIQSFLRNNSDFLLANNLCFPAILDIGYYNHSTPLYLMFHENPLSHHMIKKIVKDKNVNINSLKNEIDKSIKKSLYENTGKNIIFSGEDISLLDKTALLKLKKYFTNIYEKLEFEIYIYVREPVSWSKSNFQEIIKQGLLDINKALKMKYQQNISIKIDRLASVFSDSKVKVCNFDHILSDKADVVEHFLELIGAKLGTNSFCRVNESLSMEKLLAINLAKIYDLDNKLDYSAVLNSLIPNKGSNIYFPDWYVDKIANESYADVCFLEEKYNIKFKQTAMKNNKSLNGSILNENILQSLSCLSGVYKKNYSLASAYRDLSLSLETFSMQLSAALMCVAYNLRNGPFIAEKLNNYICSGNITGFFEENKFHMTKGSDFYLDSTLLLASDIKIGD